MYHIFWNREIWYDILYIVLQVGNFNNWFFFPPRENQSLGLSWKLELCAVLAEQKLSERQAPPHLPPQPHLPE